jgi:hypothetical protein
MLLLVSEDIQVCAVFPVCPERRHKRHGYAKSDTANISRKELVRAKGQAKTLFTMTDTQIQRPERKIV